MAYVTTKIPYPINQWDKKSIRPGPVGSIGDVLTSIRIKQSSTDMPFAYDKTFAPKNDVLRGSNVQDGQWYSFSDGGYGAQVKRRKLDKNPSFKTATGWIQQDIIPTDRYVEPKPMPLGKTVWNTQVSEILTKQGTMFQESPGGYAAPPNTMFRGNQFPRPVNLTAINPIMPTTAQVLTSVVTPMQDQATSITKPVNLASPIYVKTI